MAEKSLFRLRNTPSVPYVLHVDDADGSGFDTSFKLAYDMNAFAAFEEVTGLNLLAHLGSVLDNPSVTTVSALFWAALHLNHPEYANGAGLRAIRANLTLANAKSALAACLEAFMAQLPPAQAAKMKAAQEKAAQGETPTPDPLAPGQPTAL